MFGILNNKIQLSGTDVATPVSNLTVGYSINAGQNLYVNGPYSSLSGSLTVGRDVIVAGSISNPGVVTTANYTSITGTTAIGAGLNVLGTMTGTALQISGPFASVTGNIFAGSNLNVIGTMSGTALQISGFASVTGNISAGSALNVVGTITGTALQIIGPFASVTGNVVAGSSLIAATVSSQLLTVATTADVYGVVSARSGTGGLQVINSASPSLQVVSSAGTLGELGMVTSASNFSSSSSTGDLVLRAIGGGRLLLNTGVGSAAVVISGTMVGINTTPSFGLDVFGNSRVVGSLSATYQIASAPNSTGSSSFAALTDTGSSTILFQNGSAKTNDGGTLSSTLRNNAGGDVRILNSNSVGMVVQGSSGFIGINKTPNYQLDVNGLARINNTFLGSISGSCYLANQNQANAVGSAFALYQGSGGDTVVNSASGQPLEFKIGNTEYVRLTSNGLLGIGTSVPGYNLDVSGTVRCTSSLLANNCNLGDCGFGSSYACFSHSSRFNTGGYSFLSDNAGATFINCSSGNQINFRCNNSGIATLDSSGNLTCNGLTSNGALVCNSMQSNGNITCNGTVTTSALKTTNAISASSINLSDASAFTGKSGQLNNDAGFYRSNATPLFGYTQITPDVNGAGIPNGANGILQIRTNPGQAGVSIYTNATSQQYPMIFYNKGGISFTGVGSIGMNGNAVSFNTSSDARLKTNIETMSTQSALERIIAMRPCIFEFKTSPGLSYRGFLAHELQEVESQAVTGGTDDVNELGEPLYQQVDLSKLVPTLVAAMKQLSNQVQTMQSTIDSMSKL